jgi:hypothetical protein
MEELRGHDPKPNAQERAWMSADPFAVVVKLVALAGLAIAIGVSATQVTGPSAPATVAAAQP